MHKALTDDVIYRMSENDVSAMSETTDEEELNRREAERRKTALSIGRCWVMFERSTLILAQ